MSRTAQHEAFYGPSMGNGEVEVTATHISQSWSDWRTEHYVSIPLHMVCSISFRYVAPVGWLVLGAILLLAAAVLWVGVLKPRITLDHPYVIATIAATGLGVICIGAYFIGRKQTLVLASPTEKIILLKHGSDRDELREFGQKVESQQRTLLGQMVGKPETI